MKKKIKIFFVIVISLFLFIIASYYAFWWASYYMFPYKAIHVENSYKELPSEELIKKLGFWNILWREIAMDVLAERKEKDAVPHFIKLLNSSIQYTRESAIRALGEMGDIRAAEPLMNIVGERNIDITDRNPHDLECIIALKALARMKYEPVYEYALWLVNLKEDPYDFRSYGITMLEYFEKPKSIPVLEKIAREDPEEYIRKRATKVIEHIKFLNDRK